MTLSRSQLINHLESCLYSLVYLSFVCIRGINVIDLNTIFVSGRHSYSQKKQSLVRSTFYHMLSFGYCCSNFFTCIQNTSLQHYLARACFRIGSRKRRKKNFVLLNPMGNNSSLPLLIYYYTNTCILHTAFLNLVVSN